MAAIYDRTAWSRRFPALVAAALAAAVASGAGAQMVEVDTATGLPGDTVEFAVSFVGQGAGASALKVDLGFDPQAPILAHAGRPACNVNPDIMKESTTFVFLPPGCRPSLDCAEVRAAIISFAPDTNPLPVPNGVVFSCALTIPAGAGANDRFELAVDSASAVFPDGREIDISAASQGGSVRVAEPVPCPGDLDSSGDVTLGEVQKAFAAYLNGCSGAR